MAYPICFCCVVLLAAVDVATEEELVVVDPLVGFFRECLVILMALLGGALDDGLDFPILMMMICASCLLT